MPLVLSGCARASDLTDGLAMEGTLRMSLHTGSGRGRVAVEAVRSLKKRDLFREMGMVKDMESVSFVAPAYSNLTIPAPQVVDQVLKQLEETSQPKPMTKPKVEQILDLNKIEPDPKHHHLVVAKNKRYTREIGMECLSECCEPDHSRGKKPSLSQQEGEGDSADSYRRTQPRRKPFELTEIFDRWRN